MNGVSFEPTTTIDGTLMSGSELITLASRWVSMPRAALRQARGIAMHGVGALGAAVLQRGEAICLERVGAA